jgi:hypothetical protein
MNNEKIYNNAFLSFKSFLQFMIIAGLIISSTGVIVHIFSFIIKYITKEPDLTLITFFKPFLSMIIEPIDALISGLIFYPVYKIVVKKYIRLSIKIRIIKTKDDEGIGAMP